jgi:hypothetical protein
MHADIARRVADLDAPTAERLLQATLDHQLASGTELGINDEEDARELVAAFVSQHDADVRADDVVPPAEPVDSYVERVLAMIAEDPDTADAVATSLETLPDETQMVVEPVTAALVLAAIVAFLQTKFEVRINRKDGKTEFSFSAAKKPTSSKTLGEIADVVRKASIG